MNIIESVIMKSYIILVQINRNKTYNNNMGYVSLYLNQNYIDFHYYLFNYSINGKEIYLCAFDIIICYLLAMEKI